MINTAFCLMGPTASGKTQFACDLVSQYPFEIISVDSAMIYKEMNIGTAKPDEQTLQVAPHHLIDFLEPTERYSAARFCTDVHQLIADIKARGNIPLLVGGTMMYFKSLQQGLSPLPEANETIREALLEKAHKIGWPAMHDWLNQVDPVSADKIKPQDTQRIQRALEVFEMTQKPLSAFQKEKTKQPLYRYHNMILLPSNRKWLHERIAQRFHMMIEQGLLGEIKRLLQRWPLSEKDPALRSVGYRQAYLYLNGQLTYEEFIEKGIAATRQLAKRQLTWLRHWPEGNSIFPDEPKAYEKMNGIIRNILNQSNK